MGSSLAKISNYFSKKDEIRVLILGLDAAGKTTILYVAKLGEVTTTIPMIGFGVETITYGKLNITEWDLSGNEKIRTILRHYYANTSALAFVVDSNDVERITEASEQLHMMANEEELSTVPILIFANKQDLPNALGLDQLKEKLQLSKLDDMKRTYHLQPCSAIKNEGIDEGFLWLTNAAKSKVDLT